VRFVNIAWVMLGAALGGGMRYALGTWIVQRWNSFFPWHTLAINVAGAFLLGLLMALAAHRGVVTPEMRLFLGVGVLGGFTTFSALSYETVVLLERGMVMQGIANMVGSMVLGIAAVLLGMLVGRTI